MEKIKRYHSSKKHSFNSNAKWPLIPSPAILESYEEIAPGSTNKILELLEKEQKHRHSLELRKLRNISYTRNILQLISGVIAICIIYSSILLTTKYDRTGLAVFMFIAGFACILTMNLANLSSLVKKKHNFKERKQS